jgi:hypothetical protein
MSSRRSLLGPDQRTISAILRALTALIGGYLCATALAATIVRMLPIGRAEAAGWGLVLSFGLYGLAILYAYAETRLARVAIVIWGSATLLFAILFATGLRL